MATNDAQLAAIDALAKIPVDQPATIAEVIDWIEAELAMEDGNFRDVAEVIATARARFVRQ